jgi:hypothetical protein
VFSGEDDPGLPLAPIGSSRTAESWCQIKREGIGLDAGVVRAIDPPCCVVAGGGGCACARSVEIYTSPVGGGGGGGRDVGFESSVWSDFGLLTPDRPWDNNFSIDSDAALAHGPVSWRVARRVVAPYTCPARPFRLRLFFISK